MEITAGNHMLAVLSVSLILMERFFHPKKRINMVYLLGKAEH